MPTVAERRAAVYEAAAGVHKQYDRVWYASRIADKSPTPELWQALADQGLLGLGVSADVGGMGGMVELVAAQEAVAEAGIPTLELLVTAFARTAVDLHGSDEQRRRWEQGGDAGPGSNMAKLLASEAAVAACDAAIQTHGGYGFDRATDVLDLWKVARLRCIAPINNEMLLNYVAEKVMGLPRSY